MARRPDLVEKAETIVEQFVVDWQKRPRFWYTEADVQAELAVRLRKFLGLQGMNSLFARYPGETPGLTGMQEWARVTCEPTIYYAFEGEKNCECRPDLVIWDNANAASPPDAEGGNWPIIWACEIKYQKYNLDSWDRDKLRHLIDQEIVAYGCWLVMTAVSLDSAKGIRWEQDSNNTKIWTCYANLLPLED